ncbi:hypothetical protein [Capnocytophaga ochracea]|uniref:hypothetical protein n=1 Tax=Capnocytophaga ochracea TaxID=1018 RepID=UPI0015EB3A1F|nr:hypothetical protein [Capnocytophaga ochracea]
MRSARAVVARQTDNEKTNKRRCEPHGQINKRRTKNEENLPLTPSKGRAVTKFCKLF